MALILFTIFNIALTITSLFCLKASVATIISNREMARISVRLKISLFITLYLLYYFFIMFSQAYFEGSIRNAVSKPFYTFFSILKEVFWKHDDQSNWTAEDALIGILFTVGPMSILASWTSQFIVSLKKVLHKETKNSDIFLMGLLLFDLIIIFLLIKLP